jgi:hypothetical protein
MAMLGLCYKKAAYGYQVGVNMPDKTKNHNCEEMRRAKWVGYGGSIEWITFFEGTPGMWVAMNSEYATEIKFCPFCGVKIEEDHVK